MLFKKIRVKKLFQKANNLTRPICSFLFLGNATAKGYFDYCAYRRNNAYVLFLTNLVKINQLIARTHNKAERLFFNYTSPELLYMVKQITVFTLLFTS